MPVAEKEKDYVAVKPIRIGDGIFIPNYSRPDKNNTATKEKSDDPRSIKNNLRNKFTNNRKHTSNR